MVTHVLSKALGSTQHKFCIVDHGGALTVMPGAHGGASAQLHSVERTGQFLHPFMTPNLS